MFTVGHPGPPSIRKRVPTICALAPHPLPPSRKPQLTDAGKALPFQVLPEPPTPAPPRSRRGAGCCRTPERASTGISDGGKRGVLQSQITPTAPAHAQEVDQADLPDLQGHPVRSASTTARRASRCAAQAVTSTSVDRRTRGTTETLCFGRRLPRRASAGQRLVSAHDVTARRDRGVLPRSRRRGSRKRAGGSVET